jgi:DNA invertase Pin-like site-specific DNA recombinase
MSKRYAYLGAKKYQELELFRGVAKADKLFVDLVDNAGRNDIKELNKMLEMLETGDTVIVQSLTNFTDSTYKLYEKIKFFKDKEIKLVILDQTYNERALLTESGFQILESVLNLQGEFKWGEKYRSRKTGKATSSYPDGFYNFFIQYKDGEIKAKDAADSLSITVPQFYSLVRAFS